MEVLAENTQKKQILHFNKINVKNNLNKVVKTTRALVVSPRMKHLKGEF